MLIPCCLQLDLLNLPTDFSFILVVAVAVTGAIWILDVIWRMLKRYVIHLPHRGNSRGRLSWVVEYARVFFPVLLVVFVLRSFVVEPFRIPSGSMLPTLEIGDFILVNKYEYGIRLPVLNKKIIELNEPEYGDVMVFRFPHDESVNYIKRVVGLPGDSVVYQDKKISVNGHLIAQDVAGDFVIHSRPNRKIQTKLLEESFGIGQTHQILHDERRGSRTLVFKVPEDTYFVLGDNRDYSNDSRFWGYVPEENIIGRAFFIWFSWNSSGGAGVNWNRIAAAIE